MKASTLIVILTLAGLTGFAELRILNLVVLKEQNRQQVKAWEIETARGFETRRATLFERCLGLCTPGQVCVGDNADRCLSLCVTGVGPTHWQTIDLGTND